MVIKEYISLQLEGGAGVFVLQLALACLPHSKAPSAPVRAVGPLDVKWFHNPPQMLIEMRHQRAKRSLITPKCPFAKQYPSPFHYIVQISLI